MRDLIEQAIDRCQEAAEQTTGYQEQRQLILAVETLELALRALDAAEAARLEEQQRRLRLSHYYTAMAARRRAQEAK